MNTAEALTAALAPVQPARRVSHREVQFSYANSKFIASYLIVHALPWKTGADAVEVEAISICDGDQSAELPDFLITNGLDDAAQVAAGEAYDHE